MNPLDPETIAVGADQICQALSTGQPVFIGRNGSTEMEATTFWNTHRHHSATTADNLRPWNLAVMRKLQRGAGVWPATVESCDAWAKEYVEGLTMLDGTAAGWYEPYRAAESLLLDQCAPQAFRTPLRSLEPYYVEPEDRWTALLAGRRVAVVSSFAETIHRQILKRDIWANQGTILPPTTTWIPIRTFYPPDVSMGDATGWPPGIESWDDAVQMLVDQVKASGATIALIGCGGLGMILGARLKREGISVIIMGGAIQVLFGIKGLRWESHPIISRFWNDSWVWPAADEIPRGAFKVEGGCYWERVVPTIPVS